MRAVFGILSLLMVVAIVGVIAKKQLGAATHAGAMAPGSASAVMPATTAGATPQQQSQQIQQQVKQSVEAAMQQARPDPDGQ